MSEEIIKLSDYSHHRLRTEMYFGPRILHTQPVLMYRDGVAYISETSWVPAIYTAFREILDNSLDEVVGHGQGNTIKIEYNESTKEFSVEDNGRGIPIDWDPVEKRHKATLVVVESRAGRNFKERGTVAGTNGLGMSVVASCSEYFRIEIHRDGKKFNQDFSEGNIVDDALQIGKPKLKDTVNKQTGTKTWFRPSAEVFPDQTLPEQFVASRVYEIAVANPFVKFYYNGEHIKVKPKTELNFFPSQKTIALTATADHFKSRFWLVPDFVADGDFSHSVVNNIIALNGGVHVETFKKTFFSNLLTALEREGKKRKLTPNRSDITEGILLFNITSMNAPNFDSQSKTRLVNEEVGGYIKKYLENEELYADIIKKNREWIDSIFERCALRTQKKDAAEISKMAKKLNRNKVPDLMDATGNDRKNCILFLSEGKSAIASLSSVRNPELHGGLPLRGKVMNVCSANIKDVMESEALKDIMNSIGLVPTERANRHALRYGKIYIAADMDPDGANITALLVNFFYTYWPELFDPLKEPFINVFMTPFIIADNGKTREYWYAHNYHEFDPKKYNSRQITRAKGLGSLTEVDWQHALQDPICVPLVDDGCLKESLDLLFNGTRAGDRKIWMGR